MDAARFMGDRALERLLERAGEDEPVQAPRTDAEHRRLFGWGWDSPDRVVTPGEAE